MRRLALLLTMVACAPAAVAQPFAASHLAAAEDMLLASNTPLTLAQSIDAMVSAQVERQPFMAPFRDVMMDFLQEHMGWQASRDTLVAIYAEAFTEEELREATAFLRSPTGQKMALHTPVLMARGMAYGQRVLASREDELLARLHARGEALGLWNGDAVTLDLEESDAPLPIPPAGHR